MDFLTLFAIYVVVLLTCMILVCKFSGQRQTPFTVPFNYLEQVRNVFCFLSFTPHIDTVWRYWADLFLFSYKDPVNFLFIDCYAVYAKMAPKVFPAGCAHTISSKVCTQSKPVPRCVWPFIISSHSLASTCRNNTFIYLHILLEAAVYAEFTYEVFGFCREMDTTLLSLSVPYVLLGIKMLFFYLCIKRDPG